MGEPRWLIWLKIIADHVAVVDVCQGDVRLRANREVTVSFVAANGLVRLVNWEF